jgi:hypothetical protein
MIELTKELKLKYDTDVELFNNQIFELKAKSIIAKKRLLSENFIPYKNGCIKEDKIKFVNQFIDFLSDLTLFPNDEIINKLREFKFAKNTLKWFVNLEEILNEINRLTNIDGLFFLPNSFLFAITNHLKIKFTVNLIEDFELNADYNNSETNIVFKDFVNRYKRREYNEIKNQSGKMDDFEIEMNNLLDNIEIATENNKELANKILLQSIKGNTSYYCTMLDLFHCKGISRDKIYLELFPLLNLILKDYKFLSYEEFYESEKNIYKSNYNRYKIARVKKIIQKK